MKRTSRNYQKAWLKKNNHLKILDLGCSLVNYWPEANHYADIDDFTKAFNDLNLKLLKLNQMKNYHSKIKNLITLFYLMFWNMCQTY